MKVSAAEKQDGQEHGTNMGLKIRQLRNQKALSQYRLSIMSNVPQSSISRLENGAKTGVSSRTLERIAAALNTTIDFLVAEGSSLQAGHNAQRWMEILRSTIKSADMEILILDSDLYIIESSVYGLKNMSTLKSHIDEKSFISINALLQSINDDGARLYLKFTASDKVREVRVVPISYSTKEDSSVKKIAAYALYFDNRNTVPRLDNRADLIRLIRIVKKSGSPLEDLSEYLRSKFRDIESICWIKESYNPSKIEFDTVYTFSRDGVPHKTKSNNIDINYDFLTRCLRDFVVDSYENYTSIKLGSYIAVLIRNNKDIIEIEYEITESNLFIETTDMLV